MGLLPIGCARLLGDPGKTVMIRWRRSLEPVNLDQRCWWPTVSSVHRIGIGLYTFDAPATMKKERLPCRLSCLNFENKRQREVQHFTCFFFIPSWASIFRAHLNWLATLSPSSGLSVLILNVSDSMVACVRTLHM